MRAPTVLVGASARGALLRGALVVLVVAAAMSAWLMFWLPRPSIPPGTLLPVEVQALDVQVSGIVLPEPIGPYLPAWEEDLLARLSADECWVRFEPWRGPDGRLLASGNVVELRCNKTGVRRRLSAYLLGADMRQGVAALHAGALVRVLVVEDGSMDIEAQQQEQIAPKGPGGLDEAGSQLRSCLRMIE